MASNGAAETNLAIAAKLKFATWAAGAVPTAFLLHKLLFRGSSSNSGGLGLAFTVTLAAAAFLWLGVVSEVVPEPYLDEVFHIPQAQRYCQGRFFEWDDKITTPPGLYWLSISIPQAAKSSGLIASYACDPKTLRATNAISLIALSYMALLCRKEVEARLHEAHSSAGVEAASQYAMHTAFNVALFPVLFFFSGLYYTDVVSTAVVLAAFLNHLHRVGGGHGSPLSDIATVCLGLCALAMRQTNVFWVVVFMGGLEAVDAVKSLRPPSAAQPYMTTLSEQLLFFVGRWSVGHVHDLPLHMARPQDMLLTAVSLMVAAVCNPVRVARQTWPYVAVLCAFAGFVARNGGVVLGDKSNHVATIHLPQMLYVWAFFGFFSLPLFAPYAVSALDALRSPSAAVVPQHRDGTVRASEPAPTSSSSGAKSASQPLSLPLKAVTAIFHSRLPWLLYLVSTLALSTLVVRFNTIIHPFTLADNRHYMFYVFRYTIRRARWIRYFLILPYTVSRWLVWGTLSGCASWVSGARDDACSARRRPPRPLPFECDPFVVASPGRRGSQSEGKSAASDSRDAPPKTEKEMSQQNLQDPLRFSTEPVPTSTGLILLLAATLSLVTAPLVEPRYFIIPWVMWRLLVPAWSLHDHQEAGDSLFNSATSTSIWGKCIVFCRFYDVRLVFETIWFVLINLATGYVFLFKPYVWRAEDGSVLDGGRLQRFMW
ncbi:glycosyltransferase family 59 protein [Trichoderma cornu-damae]|uniref:Dol-P-Glc:Glc(2)Man(9)GlcNAc(2)-PP-Dol alpha-1,2-glucosyltransferase n=1 Tax=Trichoderma cornu-damae TaxID=654480 RepID=A0A9P8QTP1_9HYPO|nr:glycosyltransferase family 59 protein [Trichoderma cornu-damae]